MKILTNNSSFAILLHNLRLENRYLYFFLHRESKDLYIWFVIVWYGFLWKTLVKSSLSFCTDFCIDTRHWILPKSRPWRHAQRVPMRPRLIGDSKQANLYRLSNQNIERSNEFSDMLSVWTAYMNYIKCV